MPIIYLALYLAQIHWQARNTSYTGQATACTFPALLELQSGGGGVRERMLSQKQMQSFISVGRKSWEIQWWGMWLIRKDGEDTFDTKVEEWLDIM